jgi:hypothetical protein
MATFTTQPFHELLDSDKTTPSTVLDSDGKLKQSLHNMFPSTDATDTDYWTQTNITVTESGTSPSGKAAYLLTEGTNVGANFRLHDSITVYGGRYYALSIDAKRGSGSRDISLLLGSGAFGTSVRYTLDLDTGEVTASVNGTKDAAIATELSDGWWNFTVYAEATSNYTPAFNYYMANGTNISYTGDGTSSIYVSRPRLYEASVHVPVERVTNGDASDGTNDWSVGSGSPSLAVVSGRFELTNTTGGSETYYQNVPVESGSTYRISVDIEEGTSSSAQLRAFGQGADISQHGTSTNTTYVNVFTATSSGNVSVNLRADSAGTAYFDNISITKVINDGIQNDLDGEDFIETSDSAIYHGGLEYNADGSFRGIQSFEGRTNSQRRPHPQDGVSSWTNDSNMDITYNHDDLFGDRNAAKLIPTTTSGSHYRGHNISIGSTATHTMSCFVKADGIDWVALWFGGGDQAVQDRATFNLSTGAVGTSEQGSPDAKRIEDYGDGWYRISMTSTVNASGSFAPLVMALDSDNVSASFAGNGTDGFYLVGTQVEAGSCPSPYVPTNNATRNRVKDTIHKDLVDFGFNQNELTVLCEFESAGSTGSDFPWSFCISDGSGNYRYGSYGFVTGSNKTFILNINSDEGSATNTTYESNYTPYSTIRTMLGFKGNDNAVSDDGDTVVTNSRAIPENVNLLNVGAENAFGQQLNGHVKKLIIWPKRLANATLEAESE